MALCYLLLCCAILSASFVDFTSAAGIHQQHWRHFLTSRNGTAASLAPPAPAFKCVKSGFFGHSTDCTRFFRCVDYFGNEEHFTLFEFVCAEGTIFDESISVCNHPSWVNPPPACLSAASSNSSSSGSGAGQVVASSTPCPPSTASGSESSSASSVDGVTSSTVDGSGSSSASPADLFGSTPSPVDGSSTVTSVGENGVTTSPVDGSSSTTSTDPATPAESFETVTSVPDGSTSKPSSESSISEAPVTVSPDTSATPSGPVTAAPTDSPVTDANTGSPTPSLPTASPIDSPVTASNVAPFTLQCGDNKFHRHPLRCDLYYMCIWTELSFSIDLKACPQGTNYDEVSATCLPPGKTTVCQISTFPPTAGTGSMTSVTEPLITPPTTEIPSSTLTAILPSTTIGPQYSLAPGSLYDCKTPGHFPYQLDCIRFYRCFEVQPNVLKGLLYRCPPDYGYSTSTERCEKQNTLPTCDRTGIRLPANFPVPLIPLEETTMVRLEDFESFFGNPNYFYQPRQFRFQFFTFKK